MLQITPSIFFWTAEYPLVVNKYFTYAFLSLTVIFYALTFRAVAVFKYYILLLCVLIRNYVHGRNVAMLLFIYNKTEAETPFLHVLQFPFIQMRKKSSMARVASRSGRCFAVSLIGEVKKKVTNVRSLKRAYWLVNLTATQRRLCDGRYATFSWCFNCTCMYTFRKTGSHTSTSEHQTKKREVQLLWQYLIIAITWAFQAVFVYTMLNFPVLLGTWFPIAVDFLRYVHLSVDPVVYFSFSKPIRKAVPCFSAWGNEVAGTSNATPLFHTRSKTQTNNSNQE